MADRTEDMGTVKRLKVIRFQADHAYVAYDGDSARALAWDDEGYEADTQRVIDKWVEMGRKVVRLPRDKAVAAITADNDL